MNFRALGITAQIFDVFVVPVHGARGCERAREGVRGRARFTSQTPSSSIDVMIHATWCTVRSARSGGEQDSGV